MDNEFKHIVYMSKIVYEYTYRQHGQEIYCFNVINILLNYLSKNFMNKGLRF